MAENLFQEQRRFHFTEGKETQRDRTLLDYESVFDVKRDFLVTDILKFAEQKDGCVFVDYGCGDGVALREAKELALKRGLEGKVKTYGVDALPMNGQRIEDLAKHYPNEYSSTLLDSAYVPTFYESDIETVKIPQRSDIATLSEVIYYTRNPLKVLANVLSQSKQGGHIYVSALNRLHLTNAEENGNDIGTLFGKHLHFDEKKIPGFTILSSDNGIRTIFGPDSIVLKKETKETDPSKILALTGLDKYRLIDRVELRIQGGMEYFYLAENN